MGRNSKAPDKCINFADHPRMASAKKSSWGSSRRSKPDEKVSIYDCFEQFRQTEKLG